MENQHQKIKGYRELTQAEIDLMNRIKAHGEATAALIEDVSLHLSEQNLAALNLRGEAGNEEQGRIGQTEPRRWLNMARTDLQVGTMKLVRAVAQPTTF